MRRMFTLIPTFIIVVALVVGGVIIYSLVRGIGQWTYNNAQPVLTAPATLVAKRTEARSGSSDMPVRTYYYATFEREDGTRQEFGISGQQYGLLAESDRGMLTAQGTRFKGFTRAAAGGQ